MVCFFLHSTPLTLYPFSPIVQQLFIYCYPIVQLPLNYCSTFSCSTIICSVALFSLGTGHYTPDTGFLGAKSQAPCTVFFRSLLLYSLMYFSIPCTLYPLFLSLLHCFSIAFLSLSHCPTIILQPLGHC